MTSTVIGTTRSKHESKTCTVYFCASPYFERNHDAVAYESLMEDVKSGDTILLDDGRIELLVERRQKLVVTGRPTGAKGSELCDYLMETIQDPGLEKKWQSHQPKAA